MHVSEVATDESGRPVRDLKKTDFAVLEAGEAQRVTHFFAAATLRARAVNQLIPIPHSMNVIVIDYLNTPWAAQTATWQPLIQALHGIGEDDFIAIYTRGMAPAVLHEEVLDRKSLEASWRKPVAGCPS